MNLIEEYKRIKRNYYPETNNDFESDFKNTKEIIYKFFADAEKTNWIEDFNNITTFRSNHSISLLYLGLILQDKLKLNLTIKIGDITFPFVFYWSILCFYHDLGYTIEENETEFYKLENRNYISNKRIRGPYYFNGIVERDLNCSYYRTIYFSQINKYIFEEKYIRSKNKDKVLINSNNYNETQINRINSINDVEIFIKDCAYKVSKNYFCKKTIDSYYIYRIKESKVYDHGIVAGYELFNKAIETYWKKFDDMNSYKNNNIVDFFGDYRHFCIEQLTLFSYIADCIISHNVFFSTFETKDKYLKYKLDELITIKKINYRKNPILYFLDILDCIDPIKFFSKRLGLGVEEILSSIDVEFNKMVISMELCENSKINNIDFNKYCKKCLSLNEYIDINVKNNNHILLFKLE